MGQRVFVIAGDNEALRALPELVDGDIEIAMLQSSNEALWELQQIAPDVLVADYDLPGFSGLDLADLVPNFAPDTRVVLCARNPQGDVQKQAAQHGVFRLLTGNSSPADIQAALADALKHIPPPRPEPEPVIEPEIVVAPPAPAPVRPPRPAPEPAPAPSRMTGPPPVSARPAPAPANSGISKAPPQASARPTAAPPNSGVSKAPQQVSARPTAAPANSGVSKAPQQVSARPTAAPPNSGVSKAPQQVSARPEPVQRASAPSVSQRPSAQAAARPATPTPPPVAAPPPAAPPSADDDWATTKSRKQGGPLVLTTQTLAPLVAKLKDLGMQLGAQATVLTDRWGVPLVQEGQTSLPLPPFLPLLATSFSTMVDYTRQLHSNTGNGLYMHEGDRYDIYIFDVGKQFLLMMIFDKVVAASKLGSVWLYAKRAVRELAEELEHD